MSVAFLIVVFDALQLYTLPKRNDVWHGQLPRLHHVSGGNPELGDLAVFDTARPFDFAVVADCQPEGAWYTEHAIPGWLASVNSTPVAPALARANRRLAAPRWPSPAPAGA